MTEMTGLVSARCHAPMWPSRVEMNRAEATAPPTSRALESVGRWLLERAQGSRPRRGLYQEAAAQRTALQAARRHSGLPPC